MTEEEQAHIVDLLHQAGIVTMELSLDWIEDMPIKEEG